MKHRWCPYHRLSPPDGLTKRSYTVVTTLQGCNMPELDTLLTRISTDYPDLSFIESAHFGWHAGKKHVSYQSAGKDAKQSMWALLHELGHALLGHADFKHDIELVQLEVAAWERARSLAKHYGLKINEDYIQDCLDTYRDWLHLRATCP